MPKVEKAINIEENINENDTDVDCNNALRMGKPHVLPFALLQ